MSLEQINNWEVAQAQQHFYKCCASKQWANTMVQKRPFTNLSSLLKTSQQVWMDLSEKDWLEAFAGHSKIGDLDSLKSKYVNTQAWSENEQSGVQGAQEEILKELKKLNEEYEQKFGFIFIVCATGKSAEEMLRILKSRMQNTREQELICAAQEQDKITKLRLEKLL